MDVGEENPRTIISGLVEYVPIESMQVCHLEVIQAKSAMTDSCHKLLKVPALPARDRSVSTPDHFTVLWS